MNFKIRRLYVDNLPSEIYDFMKSCAEQGLENNVSEASMKFGKWKDEAWWCTWVDNKIVSISGCHAFDDYIPDSYRVCLRTATLKEYRGKAPGSIKKMHNDFNWGHILPYQIEYAKSKGAKRIVFTTNSEVDKSPNSFRTNKVVEKVFIPQGLCKLVEKDVEVFYTKQNIWEVI